MCTPNLLWAKTACVTIPRPILKQRLCKDWYFGFFKSDPDAEPFCPVPIWKRVLGVIHCNGTGTWNFTLTSYRYLYMTIFTALCIQKIFSTVSLWLLPALFVFPTPLPPNVSHGWVSPGKTIQCGFAHAPVNLRINDLINVNMGNVLKKRKLLFCWTIQTNTSLLELNCIWFAILSYSEYITVFSMSVAI